MWKSLWGCTKSFFGLCWCTAGVEGELPFYLKKKPQIFFSTFLPNDKPPNNFSQKNLFYLDHRRQADLKSRHPPPRRLNLIHEISSMEDSLHNLKMCYSTSSIFFIANEYLFYATVFAWNVTEQILLSWVRKCEAVWLHISFKHNWQFTDLFSQTQTSHETLYQF